MFLSNLLTPWTLLLIPILYYLLPYLRNASIRSIPGPPLASISNLWLLLQCRRASRYLAVDAAHKRYGTLVRIQPDHVSVADDAAIPLIYGHGNGFLKADFYDAFVSIHRGLFNVRDRAAHTRKRKIVSNTFSQKSIGQFEPYIHSNLSDFVAQWDRIAETGKTLPNGYAPLDALHWFNFLAFDIIGDLAFGQPFGMVEKGADVAEVRLQHDAAPTFAPAIDVLNRRGEVSATLGCLPALKPYAKHLPDPFFRKGVAAVQNLAGIAVARVKARLENEEAQSERKDLLARLMEGKDETGAPLGREELTAEALTQLIAGSDTTSNTSCALLFHCLNTKGVVEKLQRELDEAVPDGVEVPDYEMVRDLPYMDKVIKETLRIHSTSSLGLPRQIPATSPALSGQGSKTGTPGSVTIAGHAFPPGTVLSVPAYTIHHSKEIWGPDADSFDPERWDKDRLTERQKNAFIPFSYGPRACVGRNVAEMELALIVSTVFRRYEWELRQTGMETREGFLRKPMGLKVGMRRRRMGGK
ncbi:MAG: hypothetical protein M1828_005575 [Chrysothrix sp. TS-e1954]|nr:MAG: hypothetical protein M1828_005575 [Chrysothrix sp. TS-e1954]